MEYVSFGEVPSRDWPGSRRLWHSFRICHNMYNMWDNLRNDPEEGKKAIRRAKRNGSWEARYIPQSLKQRKTTSSKGQDAP